MQRKNVIVVISEEVEVFGNFKKMCEAKGFPYHSLKMMTVKDQNKALSQASVGSSFFDVRKILLTI